MSPFVLPAFCDSCGAPMANGVPIGVARESLPVGDPSYPCPSCFLGTGRLVDGAYSALVEGVRVLLTSSPDDLRPLRDLLESLVDAVGEPGDEVLDRFEEGSPPRRLLELIPWQRPDVWALVRIIAALLRWSLSPSNTTWTAPFLAAVVPTDEAIQGMIRAYVTARLEHPGLPEPDPDEADDDADGPVDEAEEVEEESADEGDEEPVDEADEPEPPAAGDDGDADGFGETFRNGHQVPELHPALRMLRNGGDATATADQEHEPEPAVVGRNQPCACGSGRKFKYCHGR